MFSCIVSVWTSFILFISVIWIFYMFISYFIFVLLQNVSAWFVSLDGLTICINEYDVVIVVNLCVIVYVISLEFFMSVLSVEFSAAIISFLSVCLSFCLSCTHF